MNKNKTLDYFERHAGTYDEFQEATVPRYEEMLKTMAEVCLHYTGKGRFLDQGCGTGNLALKLLGLSPQSKIFLLDGSHAMLDQAMIKLKEAGLGENIAGSKVINLEDPGWSHGIDLSFDAIVSAFVLEHLDEGAYKQVLRENLKLLKPGGAFITLEWSDDAYGMQTWFMNDMRITCEAQPDYRSVVDDAKRMETHYFVNIGEKLRWIEEAGFKGVHTVWQYLFGYVVVGQKEG
jgi:ubiquinone/menaquinone biosynthesis C-methylase UbiE